MDDTAATRPSGGSSPGPGPRLSRGAVVGRYVIVEFIDQGGMGVVYKAFDPELNRPVALKLVGVESQPEGGGSVPSGDSAQSAQRSRLLREAQALAHLSHPNIVTVYDVGPYREGVFMAMEFVEGETLRALLAAGRTRRQLLDVMLAAGRGLGAAHRAGITHRDFKPSNVIVGKDGRVRVIDFGLARAQESLRSESGADPAPDADSEAITQPFDRLADPVTQAGTIVGTPQYMAPEQFLAQRSDERSDQFSFCLVLFQTLYGQLPFSGQSPEEIAESVRRAELRRPSGHDVPAWLDRIVERGLRFLPEERFASMEVLLDALTDDPEIAAAARKKRRRGAAVLIGSVLTIGAAGWAIGHATRGQERLCALSSEHLAGIWDPDVERTVEASFRSTGRPYARQAFATVSAALTRFAARWSAMYTESCEATRVRGEQSDEMLTLRTACLDERLRQLRALTTLLQHADDELLLRGADAVARIDNLDACADTVALAGGAKLPSGPEARAKVDALREQLAAAKALRFASKFKRGLEVAAPLLPLVRALDYRPLTAETLLLMGELWTGVGDQAQAEKSLLEALLLAEETRHDEVVALAAVSLAWSLGVEQTRFEEAHSWARLAGAASRRLGDRDELTASVLTATSTIYKNQGKGKEAVPPAEQALALWLRARGPEHVLTGRGYNALGNAFLESADHGRREDYDKARAAYTRALAISERAFGEQHPSVAATLNNLAILESRDGHYDAALGYYDRALAIHEATLGADHPRVAEVLNNRARPLCQLGRYADALAAGQRALAIYEKRFGPDVGDAANVLVVIGQADVGLGRYPDAIAALERALRLIAKEQLSRDLAGDARFALAKADAGLSRVAEAVKVGNQAAADYAASEGCERELADVKAWLAKQR